MFNEGDIRARLIPPGQDGGLRNADLTREEALNMLAAATSYRNKGYGIMVIGIIMACLGAIVLSSAPAVPIAMGMGGVVLVGGLVVLGFGLRNVRSGVARLQELEALPQLMLPPAGESQEVAQVDMQQARRMVSRLVVDLPAGQRMVGERQADAVTAPDVSDDAPARPAENVETMVEPVPRSPRRDI